MLLTGKTQYKGTPMVPEYDDLDDIKAMKSPRILAFHTHFELLPKQVQEGKGKIVYIIRNPKDVLTSYYFYNASITYGTYSGTFAGFFRFFLQDECKKYRHTKWKLHLIWVLVETWRSRLGFESYKRSNYLIFTHRK